MDKSLIWVLADDRAGNSSQAIGLAESLNRPFEIKKISYSFFSKLPNFLKINGLIGITQNTKNSLLNQNQKPKIIISSGRKTAPLALFLKKYYHADFTIHIMNSGGNLNKFDLVILPKHDRISGKNIITSIGSLNRVNDELMADDYKKFASQFEKIKSPKIALIIGGSSKKKIFDINSAEILVKICINIAKNMNGNFLVTTSRRTDKTVIWKFKNELKKYCGYFFEWQENLPNPYFAILQAADYIIVTGDSMSMCSESCATGKPVYIFNPNEICTKKHLRLHQNLFDEGYAHKLENGTTKLKTGDGKKLNETSRIAKKIDELLITKNL
jgi:uncharacterized protein